MWKIDSTVCSQNVNKCWILSLVRPWSQAESRLSSITRSLYAVSTKFLEQIIKLLLLPFEVGSNTHPHHKTAFYLLIMWHVFYYFYNSNINFWFHVFRFYVYFFFNSKVWPGIFTLYLLLFQPLIPSLILRNPYWTCKLISWTQLQTFYFLNLATPGHKASYKLLARVLLSFKNQIKVDCTCIRCLLKTDFICITNNKKNKNKEIRHDLIHNNEKMT